MDTFELTISLVAGNIDTITGFSVAADTIRLSRSIFNTIVLQHHRASKPSWARGR